MKGARPSITPIGPRRTWHLTPDVSVKLVKPMPTAGSVRSCLITPATKSIVRSNSFAASPEFLQISHMSAFTSSERILVSSSQYRSMAVMRSASDICGHAPWPRSHAAAAASTAATASSSFICATLPMTARSPVDAS